MDNAEAIKVIKSNWPHSRVMLTEACELSIKALEAMDAVDNSAQQLKQAIALLERAKKCESIPAYLFRDINDFLNPATAYV